MNQYLIEYKIKTLAELVVNAQDFKAGKFNYKGYEFQQWGSSFFDKENAWIARKKIEAENGTNAINSFRRKLSGIINRIGFISQCYTAIDMEPFLVIRENNNPERKFFVHYTKEVNGTPLIFGEKEQEALRNLEVFDKEPVFEYLNESTRAGTYYTHLAMLIIALEAIAGEKKDKKGNVYTNKEYIKNKILKDETLYKKIFCHETGIRNKIFHGKEVKFNNCDGSLAHKIYEKIVEYFNREYQIKINTDVVNPQRTFRNYEAGWVWLKPKSNEVEINLRNVIKELEEHRYGMPGESPLEKFYFIEHVCNY